MPVDPKKQQKEVMKKRRKAKAASARKNQSGIDVTSLSPRALIQRARDFPIRECWISQGWQTGSEGLTQVLIARDQPNGNIAFGVYLVDTQCLGLKDTWCNADFSVRSYSGEVLTKLKQGMPMEQCTSELAHQIVYQGIDYAAQFRFLPQRDFKWSQFILSKRGDLSEPYKLTFGRNGKPLFISGPYDNVKAIIEKLERYAGAGNYDSLIMLGGDPFDDNDDES